MTVKNLNNLEAELTEERKKVDVASHNFSTRELVRMMVEDEINIAPAYQRKFRWTERGESLFIESIFLGLPIPPVFVATNAGFEWEVVDGLQRLSTLLHFMAGPDVDLSTINRSSKLELSKLEKVPSLNGLTYDILPKNLRMYFSRQPLQVVSLTDKSNNLIRFDLFERLNTGGVALSAQEVRACVYRGKFNDLLEELSTHPNFTKLIKLQQARQHDGTAAEEVLKFFAYKNNRDEFDGRVSNFLNEYMDAAASTKFSYRAERKIFLDASDKLAEICKGKPFLRSRVNTTPLVQFEACLVAIAEILQSGGTIEAPANWADDEELVDYSTGATNTKTMLEGRIDRARRIFSGNA